LNDHILPKGVKVVPFLDRSDLVHLTTHTVLHNLTEGIILVVIILILFLGNVRGALIVAITIPFSLLFASICLDLKPHSGEPALAGRAGLRHGGRWRGGDGRKHRPPSESHKDDDTRRTPQQKIQRGRARGAAAGLLRHRHHHHGLSAHLYLQSVEGRLFKPLAWTVAFALAGRADLFHRRCSGAGQHPVPQRREGVAQPSSWSF
jgi:heavy metal efflux system protein